MVAYAYASRHPEAVRRLVLSEPVIPGFGLEKLMNPAAGGYWHFCFHMQVDLAAMPTAGREAAYLLPTMRMMSISDDATDMAERIFLPHYAAPGGMRAGFQHYGTLLEDGRSNQAAFRSKLETPVLVLNGERSIPQAQTLGSVKQISKVTEAALIPSSGYTFVHDNPAWVAERMVRFLM